MEKINDNVFGELSKDEIEVVEGGLAVPIALGVAYVALFGTGFTAGVTLGIKKWF